MGPDNSLLWRMFSSNPGLCPLDASTTTTPNTHSRCNSQKWLIVRYPLGGEAALCWGTANSSVEKTPKQPYREAHITENWGLPKPCEAAILEVDLPASVRPSDDCSEGQYLDCTLLRDCEPEPLNYPAPQFLTQKLK